VAIDDFGLIPEKFLLQPDSLNAFDEASRKKIGVSPDDSIDFSIQKLEIGLRIFYNFSGFFGFLTAFKFTVCRRP
jgi:hypothetical protein